MGLPGQEVHFSTSATSWGQDRFEGFTTVNLLTLIDVYEEDTLGNINLQIWKVRHMEINGEKDRI